MTGILYLSVDHDSKEHIGQVIPLTRVCRYWRALLLSYPRMWSTLCLKPGNPSGISEWLVRGQDAPLTIIAEFFDAYEHPPCRYEDSATATLADTHHLKACPRHEAVLSLDQLLPHRSRIHDLTILVHSSDPDWDDGSHDGEPMVLYHHFFRETLPNLRRLDFHVAHVEGTRLVIPIPDPLFAGQLPRLRGLKYLGVFGGLTETAKNLTSCEIGPWTGSPGPTIISPERLQVLFNNNWTLESLAINDCEFLVHDRRATTAAPMTNLKFLRVHCFMGCDVESILTSIHTPQFKSLDTVQLSIFDLHRIQAVATDLSGRIFEFSQTIVDNPAFYPLLHLGANITTLHLGRGITLQEFGWRPVFYNLFRSLDAVQVLEFDGAADSVRNVFSSIRPGTGIFPELTVIRVAVSQGDCEWSLPLLAVALKSRMDEGNPLTTLEPLFAEGEDGLGRVEWEWHYKEKGIQRFLSG